MADAVHNFCSTTIYLWQILDGRRLQADHSIKIQTFSVISHLYRNDSFVLFLLSRHSYVACIMYILYINIRNLGISEIPLRIWWVQLNGYDILTKLLFDKWWIHETKNTLHEDVFCTQTKSMLNSLKPLISFN